MPAALALVLASVAGASVGFGLIYQARSRMRALGRALALEAERMRAAAERERQTLRMQAEVVAREEALVLRAEAEAEALGREAALAEREALLAGKIVLAEEELRRLQAQRQNLAAREPPLAEVERENQALFAESLLLRKRHREELERAAKLSTEQSIQNLVALAIDEARTEGAQLVRIASEGDSLTEVARAAKRLMGISAGRMTDHFYSERTQSIIPLPLPEGRGDRPLIAEEDLKLLEGVSGVRVLYTEEGDAIRLEGLDGVGREVARRCVHRIFRRPGLRGEALTKAAREIAAEVERDIVDSGRRAFSLLRLERAHPELVNLVGRLNFRTSYSQNQWEHSVEAGYLCGMMALELGLDVKIARRAALLHDIGKALTHELDGSHAVIGADYARRFGEREVVANAIGAHHTDEPFGSAYAHLVAAADAMSGGRPGSRRQTEDNHMAKVSEIERLTRDFRGVAEAFAVQGGREVRVLVEEDRVSDAGAVQLAADIAQTISREMTFPGQIKVTVIRELLAVELAT